MRLFGDWADDEGYMPPAAEISSRPYQHSYFEEGKHPAKIMVEILRSVRDGNRDDLFERRFIAAVKDSLGRRDKHVAEGLYWRWALSDSDWKKLCLENLITFKTLADGGRALLDPPETTKPNTIVHWMNNILDASRPTIEHTIYMEKREGITIPSPFLLNREQKEKRVDGAIVQPAKSHAELTKTLSDRHKYLARPNAAAQGPNQESAQVDAEGILSKAIGMPSKPEIDRMTGAIALKALAIVESFLGKNAETESLRFAIGAKAKGFGEMKDAASTGDLAERIAEILMKRSLQSKKKGK